jgi:outer membrane lipoprotein SlyB
MNRNKNFSVLLGLVLATTSISCAPSSRPVTVREQTAATGAVAGSAGGAIIGSLVGSAVTGDLFGLPLGAVGGYLIGDQVMRNEEMRQARLDENQAEIERLRRENERLRRQQSES